MDLAVSTTPTQGSLRPTHLSLVPGCMATNASLSCLPFRNPACSCFLMGRIPALSGPGELCSERSLGEVSALKKVLKGSEAPCSTTPAQSQS